jgi:hypothetical protein
MSATAVSNIVVPAVFAPYALERTAMLSEVIASGIVGMDPQFDALCNGKGQTVSLPYWKDLTGVSEIISDSAALTPAVITTSSDLAPLFNRGKAWGSNILAGLVAGDDPQRQIGDLVGGFWARDQQRMLLKILAGLFDTAAGVLRTTHRNNIYQDVAPASITDVMRLTGDTFVDTTVKLGDASDKLGGVVMHSDVEAFLRKRDLIDFIPDSQGTIKIKTFQGRRVIVDDGIDPNDGTTTLTKTVGTNSAAYMTFIFGYGAFAYGTGGLSPEEQVETWRDPLAHNDYLITRRHFMLHPRGVKWSGSAAASGGPSDAELATAANWTKVYTDKNIRIVACRHNVTGN